MQTQPAPVPAFPDGSCFHQRRKGGIIEPNGTGPASPILASWGGMTRDVGDHGRSYRLFLDCQRAFVLPAWAVLSFTQLPNYPITKSTENLPSSQHFRPPLPPP